MPSNLYTSNEYISKNPSLHIEDSPWKISKILPLIDMIMSKENKRLINLLDVGGGAGLILKEVSSYIKNKYNISVNKYTLDLSPAMLKIQKQNNPDMIKLLNEDIKKTSLKDKEIDITLMIDVLEHVPNPEDCLKEIHRISNFVIFKVPLENNLQDNLINFLTKGKHRENNIKNIGHINIYNSRNLKEQIIKNHFKILYFVYTNVKEYKYKTKIHKNKESFRMLLLIYNFLRSKFSKYFPSISAILFLDFAMILVEKN